MGHRDGGTPGPGWLFGLSFKLPFCQVELQIELSPGEVLLSLDPFLKGVGLAGVRTVRR